MLILGYIFFPLISWQIYFAPVFASQKIQLPIPKTTVVSAPSIGNLISSATSSFSTNLNDANNWYPKFSGEKDKIAENYSVSIPKINITNAIVSTVDTDLTTHLVQYNSDSVPPRHGNSVIFGHSTLPQLFDEKNYKTIFANAYKLQAGDEIFVNVTNVTYKYAIQSVIVVEPSDTSVLTQDFSDSFLTIITCTPPGTIWKRLVIRARIVQI